MKKFVVLITLMLVACGKAAPTDTVDSLVAHPDRLREVEKQCADAYTNMSAAECNAAGQARWRLFIGKGPQHTPPKEASKF